MGLLTPWFLLGLAAIALPIYIHLLRRHNATPQPFSSLMFFERGTQSSTRHRRLRYLLLFSLRTALLLLLILAFANPFMRLAGQGNDGKLLLLVIDNSYSMQALSRFTAAKQSALQVLASKPPGERAQVMALGGRLAQLTQPTQDARALRAAIESIEPTPARANLGELARGVRALSETVKQPIELHLFSDMQKTGMPGSFADMALPANVTVILQPADKTRAVPNWTVESVHTSAANSNHEKGSKAVRVQAVVAGYGTPLATKNILLVVNGKTVASRKVEIPPSGRATVDFAAVEVPFGLNQGAVRIDTANAPDSFSADDVSYFAVKRSDPERVLFVHAASDKRSAVYFGAALAATNQALFSLQAIESDKSADIDPARYAFVVLSDVSTLPSIFEAALLQFVRKGGSVLIATATARDAHVPIFGGTASPGHSYARDGYATISETDRTHPLFAGAAGDASEWSDLKVFSVTHVDASQARVLARLSDQTPLLMEKQVGEGKVLLFASGLDNLSNDLPLTPAFVPFIDRTARYLAGSDDMTGSRVVDAYVPLRHGQAGGSGSVEILDPDGHRALSLSDAVSAQSFQLTRAGLYQVRFADGKSALLAVNPDRRESDLEPIPLDLLQLWGGHAQAGSPAPAAALMQVKNSERSLWWYVMLLVLMAAVAESIIASRYLGIQREEA